MLRLLDNLRRDRVAQMEMVHDVVHGPTLSGFPLDRDPPVSARLLEFEQGAHGSERGGAAAICASDRAATRYSLGRSVLASSPTGWESPTVNRSALEGSEHMSSQVLLDAAGRRRSPAAMPGHHTGRAPKNKGLLYPADPPSVDEIVAVMRRIPTDRYGLRLRALIVVLWRRGLRIHEALSLTESDLDPRRGSILVKHGKGNKRREVGMDPWAWTDHLAPWVACRSSCRSARCSA